LVDLAEKQEFLLSGGHGMDLRKCRVTFKTGSLLEVSVVHLKVIPSICLTLKHTCLIEYIPIELEQTFIKLAFLLYLQTGNIYNTIQPTRLLLCINTLSAYTTTIISILIQNVHQLPCPVCMWLLIANSDSYPNLQTQETVARFSGRIR
jgi:hypothetical protein